MTETLLLSFTFLVVLIWLFRFKQTLDFSRGPHIIDRFSREALTFPVSKVSVIIPARNEEENIANCLESFIKQDYPDFEVLAVNDRSTDRTEEIIRSYAQKDNRVKLISVTELSEGWTGKNNALRTGVEQATGEWYLFTDADTVHQPQSVSMAVGHAIRRKADMLSLTPSLENKTFWEKVVQPVAGGALMLRFPLQKVNDPGSKCAFGNGQFILIKKDVYKKVGGHERVKDFMLEDIAMAKCVKTEAYQLHVGYGADLFRTRMYADFKSLWRGWTRIYYSAFDKNAVVLFALMCLVWIVSLSPYLLGVTAVFLVLTQFSFFSVLLFGGVVLQFFVIFPTLLNTYRISRSDTAYLIYHPLSVLVVFGMLANAFFKILLNRGVHWRGHRYIEKSR